MSQIGIKSPKHCTKKGCHLNFLSKKLFKILCTLTLSLVALILLIWFILHPSKPEFTLRKINIDQLNFSSPHVLNSSIEVTLESRNPNQRVGIYYDKLCAHAMYKRQQITSGTPIPTFYQGQQDSELLSASLIGNDIAVAPSFGYEISRDQAARKMVLMIKVEGKIRWKVATWVSGHYRININCVALLTLGPLNPTSPLNSKQGTQCFTNI